MKQRTCLLASPPMSRSGPAGRDDINKIVRTFNKEKRTMKNIYVDSSNSTANSFSQISYPVRFETGFYNQY